MDVQKIEAHIEELIETTMKLNAGPTLAERWYPAIAIVALVISLVTLLMI